MKIRIVGGGWYGCHIAKALLDLGHRVELWEVGEQLFSGASGANPARLHQGFHYPRSRLTRAACLGHADEFMERYGGFTRAVPINLYCVAAHDSLVDFGNYVQTLRGEVEFVRVRYPGEFGLDAALVEGAVLTGERHIVIRHVRDWFTAALDGHVRFGARPDVLDSTRFDWTIDCTFCAYDELAIDRFEPCITGLLRGRTDMAVTIMDGPFPSIYPWDEEKGLCSVTSAALTPLSKTCRSWAEAHAVLQHTSDEQALERVSAMQTQIAAFWPKAAEFEIAGAMRSIRAMPRSGADARLVDVVQTGERVLRIRAGKIDAIFAAERLVLERIEA